SHARRSARHEHRLSLEQVVAEGGAGERGHALGTRPRAKKGSPARGSAVVLVSPCGFSVRSVFSVVRTCSRPGAGTTVDTEDAGDGLGREAPARHTTLRSSETEKPTPRWSATSKTGTWSP